MSSIKLKEELDDNFIVEFKENVKTFRDTEAQRRLDFIARKKSGKPFGSAWKTFGYKGPKYHDGFLYGLVDEKLHMTGTLSIFLSNFLSSCNVFSGDHIAYIYSDFTTVLLGEFSNGTMIAARPTKIVAEKCKNGIKQLKFAKPRKDAPTLKFQRPNFLRPGDQPNVSDPFERSVIYVAPSGISKDGIFARKQIRQGDLIAYYAGTIFNTNSQPIFFRNQTKAEKYAIHRNLIGLENELQINIPEPYWNITSFRSTLGHKVNHSFINIKAQFNWVSHPRFGHIRSVTATEDVYPGEEILIHYGYPIEAGRKVPKWYKELYEKQVGAWPKTTKKTASEKHK